jgi:hypothetical protein
MIWPVSPVGAYRDQLRLMGNPNCARELLVICLESRQEVKENLLIKAVYFPNNSGVVLDLVCQRCQALQMLVNLKNALLYPVSGRQGWIVK